LNEVITIEQLTDILRQYNNLSGATVTWESDAVRLFTPQEVVIAGMITIHGKPAFWQVPLDLRNIRTRRDIDKLVRVLHKAIDGYAQRPAE
jgi:hypothetical protein